MLLLLPDAPPVPVNGHGRMEVHEAVSSCLASVLQGAHLQTTPEQLFAQLHDVVAYVTWAVVEKCIADASGEFSSGSPSTDASIRRLADAAISAISWHG